MQNLPADFGINARRAGAAHPLILVQHPDRALRQRNLVTDDHAPDWDVELRRHPFLAPVDSGLVSLTAEHDLALGARARELARLRVRLVVDKDQVVAVAADLLLDVLANLFRQLLPDAGRHGRLHCAPGVFPDEARHHLAPPPRQLFPAVRGGGGRAAELELLNPFPELRQDW
jgi:hypothetical protein